MWFWWFMLVCILLTPVSMIFCGRLMWKHAPEEVNPVIGYRTKRSMKNRDTWRFANAYAGKSWWIAGWVTLIPAVLALLPFVRSSTDTVGMAALGIIGMQIVVLIALIFPTERALKNTFDESGRRRQN